MQRTGNDKFEHDNLVRRIADHFRSQGHSVRADITEYVQPAQIGMHIPDVSSIDLSKNQHIAEIETCATINDQHTADQWNTFDHSGAKFYVVVPKICEVSAKNRAIKLGLNPIVWGI